MSGSLWVASWGVLGRYRRPWEGLRGFQNTPKKWAPAGLRLEYAAIFNLLSNLTQKGTIFVSFRSRFGSILERPEGHLGNIADANKDQFYKIKTPILVEF